MHDRSPYPGTPRWVKVIGILALVVLLLLVILIVAGNGTHGPRRHAGDASDLTPPTRMITTQAPPGDALGGHDLSLRGRG